MTTQLKRIKKLLKCSVSTDKHQQINANHNSFSKRIQSHLPININFARGSSPIPVYIYLPVFAPSQFGKRALIHPHTRHFHERFLPHTQARASSSTTSLATLYPFIFTAPARSFAAQIAFPPRPLSQPFRPRIWVKLSTLCYLRARVVRRKLSFRLVCVCARVWGVLKTWDIFLRRERVGERG